MLNAIINSNIFNVTVLVRSASSAIFPSSVKVVQVDFTSAVSLTNALKGQDALVSTVGRPGLQGQTLMIDACIAAGVSRFMPSEFGSDLSNARTKAFPVYGYKVSVSNYAEEKALANPRFSYTFLRTGVFLDWGLEKKFLLDWESSTPRIYDTGDQLFTTTTLASVGQAVVGVLNHPEETKNRAVHVQDMTVSQNGILAIVRKLAPNKKYEPLYTDTAEMCKAAHEKIASGDLSTGVLYQHVIVSIFGEGYGGIVAKSDNELLGIPGNKTDADIEAILKPLLAEAN